MALRLDTAVTHGEIDNTTRDNVRGRIWLVGREAPVILDLRGNAWRDIAGCKVTFTNPTPASRPVPGIHIKQKGYVGDITACRQTAAEASGEGEGNSLYIEWFSEENGRVFIEGSGFEVGFSAWVWEMDEAQEEAQKMTNLSAMRGWLAGIIQRPEPEEEADDADAFDDSEEAWEDSLKQSDRLAEAHMEALEKYGADGLHDDRIAFVMGWDHMLRSSDEGEGEDWKAGAEPLTEWNAEAGDDEVFADFPEGDEREAHPLQARAQNFVLRLLTAIEKAPSDDDSAADRNKPLDRFIRNSMNISGKLAGALGIEDFTGSFQTGHTLAILRRCLNWANEAMTALNELAEAPDWKDRQDLLNDFRSELFAIRDGITDLRKELRAR